MYKRRKFVETWVIIDGRGTPTTSILAVPCDFWERFWGFLNGWTQNLSSVIISPFSPFFHRFAQLVYFNRHQTVAVFNLAC
jgi:hypothetical protein